MLRTPVATHGKPADFLASISLSYLGDMQLELIQPVRGQNVYSDFLAAAGPGLHHICMEADSPEQFDAALAEATDQGAPVVQQGVMPGGIQFAYVSAPQAGVPFIEIAYVPAGNASLLRLHQTGAAVMNTDIPATVNADTVTSWSDDVDVVVIGFGIGGGCAAVSAAAAGARGAACSNAPPRRAAPLRLPEGTFTSAAGRRCSRRPVTPIRPMRCTSTWSRCRSSPITHKIRAYCDGSVEHFDWLEDLGFQFERSYFPGKAVIQPSTEGLMFTGNEKVWPFIEQAVPAPRGHKVPVPGDTGGASIVIELLLKRAASLGVRCGTRPASPNSSWTPAVR